MALITKTELLATWNAARTAAKNTEGARLKTIADNALAAIDTQLRDDAAAGLATNHFIDKVAEVDYEPIIAALKAAGYIVTPFPQNFRIAWAPDEVIVAK